MRLYFAYGSNMSRPRLEGRVGPVADLGWHTLPDHRHRFDKRGADGTAKGNLAAAAGGLVHGVLYGLSAAQLERLAAFEGGYRMRELSVWQPARAAVRAGVTFVAIAPVTGLSPTATYLAYYERGMREHGLPEHYIAELLAGATSLR